MHFGGVSCNPSVWEGQPSPIPPYPSPLGWWLHEAYRWETEAGGAGGHYSAHVPAVPMSPCQRGLSCLYVLPPGACSPLTHILMVTAS